MMFKLRLDYQITLEGASAQCLDAQLFRLLKAIHDHGSLNAAAQATGFSYRHVWGMVAKWGEFFGRPLVTLLRGRGAQLTPFGEKLLWLEQRLHGRISPQLQSVAAEMERGLSELLEEDERPLVVYASHDLALAKLRDLFAGQGLRLDLQFRGSVDALAALAGGRCDMAGFHVAESLGKSSLTHLAFRQWLKPRSQKLIHFVTREQGLLLQNGNPKDIRGLADLARPGVRFINRQRSSGTRLLLDELLWAEEVNRASIDGYQTEEFTHLAVAATVAGGQADAGFGIAAAAAQFGLDFLPLARERYFFACGANSLELPGVRKLLQLLQDADFRALAAGLAGYDASRAGEVCELGDALPWYEPEAGSRRRRQPPPR